MRPSSSRLAPIAALTALTLAGAATPAAAATKKPADKQAPVITAITVSPSPVVLAVKSGGRTSFSIAVRARDTGTGVDRVTLGLYDPKDKTGRAFRLSRTGGSAAEGLWTGLVALPNNVRTGMWAIRAFATDKSNNTTNPDAVYTNFRVLAKTRMSKLSLTVNPVTGVLTATTVLERFKKGWEPFTARELVLEFRPKGATAYKAMAKATTDARGAAAFGPVTAPSSGHWRVTYAGHPNYGPSVSKTAGVSLTVPATPTPSPTPSPTVTPAAR